MKIGQTGLRPCNWAVIWAAALSTRKEHAMSKTFSILIVIAGTTLPWLAAAHGMPPAPAHGGRVLEANENWIELVLNGSRIQVYVLDEGRMPIPVAKLGGRATVLAAGKSYRVELLPGAGNELDGQLPVTAAAQDAAVVALKIDGQPAVARFPADR